MILRVRIPSYNHFIDLTTFGLTGSRFRKASVLNMMENLGKSQESNLAQAIIKQIMALPPQMQYLGEVSQMDPKSLSREELLELKKKLNKRKNFSKFQDDLKKKIEVLKNTSFLHGDG